MSTTTFELRTPRQTTATPSIVARARDLLELWHSRARQRRHLARLSQGQLLDIGVTTEAARTEAHKAFWRA
jgi:uncharacterized protein YjiS (DUF1127 family)